MKTTTTCPGCGKVFTRAHTKDRPPKFCSRACANKAPGRMTPEIRAKMGMRAEKNPHWITGSWVSRDGRTYIRVPDSERHLHPTMRGDGYIRRYHHVWNTNNPDDPVQRGEIIHHRNHDLTDDRIENLKKWNQPDHASHHIKGLVRSPETRAKMRDAWVKRRDDMSQGPRPYADQPTEGACNVFSPPERYVNGQPLYCARPDNGSGLCNLHQAARARAAAR